MRFLVHLLFSLLVTLVVLPLHAQTSDPGQGAEIMRQVAARRATVERTGRTVRATIQTTSVIRVNSDSSTIKLIPSRTIAYESIGAYMKAPSTGARVRIGAQRRSVAAEGIAGNLLANVEMLGRYFSIEDDEIILMNTALPSPLAADATEWYRFDIVGRGIVDGEQMTELEFHPISTLYPGFTGRITVIDKTFDVARLELAPAAGSSIPFITSLRMVQTFSPIAKDRPYRPDSLRVSGSAFVLGLAFGLVESAIDFTMSSSLANRTTDGMPPDSIRLQIEPLVIVDGADSADAAFWRANGRLTGAQVEAIERSHEDAKARRSPLSFSVIPFVDYNRAGATSLGVTPGVTFGPVRLAGTGGYSFGIERPIGEGTLTISQQFGSNLTAALRGSAFSQIATTTTGDKSYPRVMNTLVSATLHQDYYNFLRKDGWSAGLDLAFQPVGLSLTYEQSRQFSIGNNARFALLTLNSKEFQANPPITDGSYSTFFGELSWGRVLPFLKITPAGSVDVRFSLMGLLGKRTDLDSNSTLLDSDDPEFSLGEGLLSVSIPIRRTGYNPITLLLLAAGGRATPSLVPQYQFRLRTSAASFGKPGGLVSPPKGLYGGTDYISVGTELNLTDLPWRAIGLPTYKGRGIELILAGGAARYTQEHHYGYSGTGDQWYTEAGIALSRIPLYLTDLVAGRVDVRKGFGPLGKVGANFTFVVPI